MFLGASYFRALCAGARYGLSARGLAVDTVGGNGEEFPHFIEFWLVKPAADARTLTLFALLDSPRVTGALSIRRRAGRRDRRRRARAPVPARRGRHAWACAVHEHVSVRREPTAPRRLSPGGARLRRAHGRDGQRRVDLAPADQPDPHAHDLVRDERASWLRHDAARPALRELRGSRGALRAAAERLDRAHELMGSGPRRARADFDAGRDERQHRRLLGAGRRAAAGPAARLRVPDALAAAQPQEAARRLRRADARRPRLSAARRGRAAVHRRLHRAHRSTHCRPTRR